MCLPKLTSPLARQLWVVAGAYCTALVNGMLMGISNSMLPALLADDSDILFDLESASWLNGLISIGVLLGYIVSSPMMATYGRRSATIIGLASSVISVIMCFLATSLTTLLLGRFLSGIGGGAVPIAIIIGEYTTPKYRGIFLNLKSCCHILGFTLTHVLGHYLHWRTVVLIMIVPLLLSFTMVFTWPESPSWLAANKRFDEATRSFYWLRGKSDQSSKELDAMIKAQKELNLNKDLTFGKKIMLVLNKFKTKNFLKPLGVYMFAVILIEASGRHIFPAYAMQFLKQMDKDKSHVFYYTLGIDSLICFSSFMSLFLVKVINRRIILLSSGAASVAVLLAVSLYYYLQSKSLISGNWNVLFLVLFAAYFFIVNVGFAPISLGLLGELFPLEHKSLAYAACGVIMGFFMFVTLKITPLLLISLKVYGTLTLYGICMGVSLIVLYFTLPETKDKTLQEIEDHFSEQISKDDNVGPRESEDLDVDTKLLDKKMSLDFNRLM